MSQAVNLIVVPVRDVAQAKKMYTKATGVGPYADQPYYVGFRVGDHEIGLDPTGTKQGMIGPTSSKRSKMSVAEGSSHG